MTLPLGTYVHSSPGRLRVRIRDKLGDAAFFDMVSKTLASRFPEAEVSVNPTTGSVLCKGIEHQESFPRVARSEGLFEMTASEKRPLVTQTVQECFTEANLAIRRSTHGELDVSTLVFLTLVGSGLYQIVRGNFSAPPWYTAFWYALGVFTKSMTNEAHTHDQDMIE